MLRPRHVIGGVTGGFVHFICEAAEYSAIQWINPSYLSPLLKHNKW
jgi:hypothetical protein